MASRKLHKWLMTAAAAALLAGCGGGGGGGSNSKSDMSTAQRNYEAAAKGENGYATIKWNLPSVGSALISGIHYLFYVTDRLVQSPRLGDQAYEITRANLVAETILPDLGTVDQKRYLKDGTIYRRGSLDKAISYFAGSNIEVDVYASDGSTRLYTDIFDEWSAPVRLSGKLENDSVSPSFNSLLSAANSEHVDLTKSWLPGSAYYKRKSYAGTDLVYVVDWVGNTTDTNVNPASSGTIEDWFNSAASTANGAKIDDIRYTLADGTIASLEGARAWIANVPRPYGASPTEQRVVFFELNSKVYYGLLIKSGTRFKTLDEQDHSIALDYSIRYNKQAVDSIAAAIRDLNADATVAQGDTSDGNEV